MLVPAVGLVFGPVGQSAELLVLKMGWRFVEGILQYCWPVSERIKFLVLVMNN